MLDKTLVRCLLAAAVVSTTVLLGCRGSGAQARNNQLRAQSNPSGPSLGRGASSELADASGRAYGDSDWATASLANSPQQTCPVTGAHLGSMGEPVPVTVKGETILVCCPRCVKKVQQNPDRYLVKVRQQTAGRR